MIIDWAGSQVWMASDEPARADQALGAATRMRGSSSGDGRVSLARRPRSWRSTADLKAAFDPAGIFNPGRMYEGL